MKIQFDRDADALYLRLVEGAAADSESIEPDVVYDYDENDQIIGIELLRVSKNVRHLALMPLPFKNLSQQYEFINFLETIADSELQSQIAFTKKILQNQRVFAKSI